MVAKRARNTRPMIAMRTFGRDGTSWGEATNAPTFTLRRGRILGWRLGRRAGRGWE